MSEFCATQLQALLNILSAEPCLTHPNAIAWVCEACEIVRCCQCDNDD